MSQIQKVLARRIWDSRGLPTVEVEVVLEDGAVGRGIAPAGASKGMNEALELRDQGTQFGGKDVSKALAGIRNEIMPALVGMDATDQLLVDTTMIRLDGTGNKSRLGANAIIATSMAVLHAAAAGSHRPLWRHLSGGKQASLLAANSNFRRRCPRWPACGRSGFHGHCHRCYYFSAGVGNDGGSISSCRPDHAEKRFADGSRGRRRVVAGVLQERRSA